MFARKHYLSLYDYSEDKRLDVVFIMDGITK